MSVFRVGHDPSEGDVVRVHIDLAALRERAMKGVRRASAFLGYGLSLSSQPPPTTVAFGGISRFDFLVDPLPPELGMQVQTEFKRWLISNSLKELDQHFSLFLDDAWNVIRMTTNSSMSLNWADTLFDQKFSQGTNAARKVQAVSEKLAMEIDHSTFSSLSLARNALSHSLGVVRPRDTNSDDALVVKWVAARMGIVDGDTTHFIDELPKPYQVKSKDGGQVILKFDVRERPFLVGQVVDLSEFELAEICFHYWRAISSIIERLNEQAKGRSGVAT